MSAFGKVAFRARTGRLNPLGGENPESNPEIGFHLMNITQNRPQLEEKMVLIHVDTVIEDPVMRG